MEREKRERILAIDVLRGFAIFGIFLVNITTFHTPYLYAGDPLFINTKLEFVIFAFVDIFIQASFYSLFAFLFGYSFMLIKEKIGDGRPFYQLALRRMVILFGIGFIHAFFIWSGDILITYALIGIVLIPLYNYEQHY